MEKNELTEVRKKSHMNCKSAFELQKLLGESCFIRFSYEEKQEEFCFTYDLSGLKSVEELKKEKRENQYQFLINFGMLESVWKKYCIPLGVDNIYYDENYLPKVKYRDLYGKGEEANEDEWLFYYLSYVGGILEKNYTVSQIQESGLEILKRKKEFKSYASLNSGIEITDMLRAQKKFWIEKEHKNKKLVSRKGNMIKNVIAGCAPVLLVVSLGFLLHETKYVIPLQKHVIEANEAYISNDYVACIDSLKDVGISSMDVSTKYILAVSYAKSENLKRDEIAGIISRLSLYSNEKELEYWISLGRGDMSTAEDLAKALSDDQLLVYGYMKELNWLESDMSISGEEKQQRMSELQNSIKELGEKYTTE